MIERDGKARKASLERQRALGEELRKTFQPIDDEDIPARLRELADDLDRQLNERERRPNGGGRKD